MSMDDPNREAVGLAPIWTGAGAEVTPQASAARQASGGFDPGEHTVADVEEYIAAHPDERDAILKAERKGKARATLTGD